jgi:hypothetical protein
MPPSTSPTAERRFQNFRANGSLVTLRVPKSRTRDDGECDTKSLVDRVNNGAAS